MVKRVLYVALVVVAALLPGGVAAADVTDIAGGDSGEVQESLRVNNTIAAMNTYRNLS